MSINKSVAKICFGHLIYITHICIFEVLVNAIITITKNDILNLKLFWVYELFENPDYLLCCCKNMGFYHTREFFNSLGEGFNYFPSSIPLPVP